MFVSVKISTYQPWRASDPIECMLVKEEKENDYKTLDFLGITEFEYEEGYEYKLLVGKTTLANPLSYRINLNFKTQIYPI